MKFFKAAITFFFLGWTLPLGAVAPMDYYNTLVAGGTGPGFRDGSFALASFNHLCGLAMDAAGNKLYAADSGNQRIRVISLDQNNEVQTLAGTGVVGAIDGPVSTATFNSPTKISVLPDNRLVVFDAGNGLIRLIDLQKQTVSTIAKELKIWDMVYRPQDDSLYFSEPETQKVEKMNMKSLVISKVLSNNSQVPNPGALCLYQDNICVADSHLPMIYEVKLGNKKFSATTEISLVPLGSAKNVLGLSSTDGFLYAVQSRGLLVKVGLPDSTLIKFPTPWGFLFKNQDFQGTLPFFNVSGDSPVGFLASSQEPRKFFISTEDSILSVKDYQFEQWWGAGGDNLHTITDFDYPAKKPARTFRILTMGSSRNSTAFPIPSDHALGASEDAGSPMTDVYSKKLEFLLNTEAALQDSNVHFEVLNLTHRGKALSSFVYDEVPDVVKKYDIDLVLGLADTSGYADYYLKPLTKEGLPSREIDPEYLLKPLSQRSSHRTAADLIKRFKELKMPISDKQAFPGDGLWSLFGTRDPQINADLKELTAERLVLLQKKLNLMKTSEGNCPQFVIFYVPCSMYPDNCPSFWSDICVQYHFKFLDLSEAYNALKISYYPTNATHYSVYGNELIARLLSHYLVERKMISF